MPTVLTRRNARKTSSRDYPPRTWTPLAQATACALLILLAVFLVAAA